MKRTPPCILLIDDNEHGLLARQTLLRQQGYEVAIASSGGDGLAQFSKQSFDVVVTDYRMPDLNGSEVIAQIRSPNKEVPIVMLSGYVEKIGLTEEQIGADIVLAKGPEEDRDLMRAVGRLVKKKPQSEQARARKARRRRAGI